MPGTLTLPGLLEAGEKRENDGVWKAGPERVNRRTLSQRAQLHFSSSANKTINKSPRRRTPLQCPGLTAVPGAAS